MRAARTIALLAATALAAGCTAAGSGERSSGAPATNALPSSAPVASPSDRPSSARPSPKAGATALAVLATVPVKGRAPKTGYERAAFGPAWTDDNGDADGHNGCDTRNDVLRRDLIHVVLKPGTHGCVVLRGELADPYTGTLIPFVRGPDSSVVQIDHVVALSDAWQTGAQRLSPARRVDLANDPLELLAVDGSVNEAKGDGDAATWLPPNHAFRCAYVARQIAVKAKYGLWMTAAEKAATARVLAACPGQRLPTGSARSPVTVQRVAPAPRPTTSHRRTTPPASSAAPGGATALCRDGSYSYAAHHQGACSHHGGVAIFYR